MNFLVKQTFGSVPADPRSRSLYCMYIDIRFVYAYVFTYIKLFEKLCVAVWRAVVSCLCCEIGVLIHGSGSTSLSRPSRWLPGGFRAASSCTLCGAFADALSMWWQWALQAITLVGVWSEFGLCWVWRLDVCLDGQSKAGKIEIRQDLSTLDSCTVRQNSIVMF